ncbi:MAG: enoyl-CoA hydratase/isomerase family protein [Deltaproteobacteria bacterium]|nr:enoyl-CoA hydratase/isomerase family protein [Deltaproteobacteria bacterium]MBW2085092.1 enoyl-CoA hydratase/isomerase family protein [Deltaproteobacteria bacterium]
MPGVSVDVDDRKELGCAARVTLDNTAKLNIINTPLIQDLIRAIESFHDDERLRVMVLTGAGNRAFIGGVDINEMSRLDSTNAEAFIASVHQICLAIRSLPVPVIARISGYCLGGGLEVAAACDMRVASEDSTFGLPEVNVGLPSVIEAALLPRLVGWGKAREIIYTGRYLSAAEALECGLVERVVSPEKLDAAVEEWVEAILNAGPQAIRLQKALIRHWEILPPDEAIEKGIQTFGQAYETDEPQRFMKRFLERRRDKD